MALNTYRHEVPGIMRKIARPSGTIEPISALNGTDNDFSRPSGTGPLYVDTQALRAWLLSTCPSGTKSHSVPLRTIQPWEATLIIIHIGQGLRWLRVRQPFPLFPRCCPLRTPTQAGSLRHFVPGYDQPVPPGQSHSPIERP